MTYEFKDGTLVIPGIEILRDGVSLGCVYEDGMYYPQWDVNMGILELEVTTQDLQQIVWAENNFQEIYSIIKHGTKPNTGYPQ